MHFVANALEPRILRAAPLWCLWCPLAVVMVDALGQLVEEFAQSHATLSLVEIPSLTSAGPLSDYFASKTLPVN